VEYQVAHVPWRVWVSSAPGFEGWRHRFYTETNWDVSFRFNRSSAFIADGSPVTVFKGTRLS